MEDAARFFLNRNCIFLNRRTQMDEIFHLSKAEMCTLMAALVGRSEQLGHLGFPTAYAQAIDDVHAKLWHQRDRQALGYTHDFVAGLIQNLARGGGFCQSLADCLARADSTNQARLIAAFPEYVRRYGPALVREE